MQDKIKAILEKAVGTPIPDSVSIKVPDDEPHGHYATNAAFWIAKEKRKNPGEVAQTLAKEIGKTAPSDFFEKIEATPSGFLNFWLARAALQNELGEIIDKGPKYGVRNVLNGRKIQIEFISANPTGPLTLANGRGGFLGDSLSNIFSLFGGEIEREYYVNDSGNQIITLGKSVLSAVGKIQEEEKFYKGSYVREWARQNKKIMDTESDALAIGKLAAKDILKGIQRVIREKAGIRFDRWTSEDEIHKEGFVQRALQVLKDKKLTYESEGALWLRTTGFGDDKDRVLMTSDKYPTYFLADAGHFLETRERGFSEKILILGPDHYGYVNRIGAIAKLLGFEKFETIVTQAALLVRDGKKTKMSKRRGDFVAFEELVDEVGADVARFFFLQVAPESHIDFDISLAKEHSAKNPVYYSQYAYVRAKKILEKFGESLPEKISLAYLTGEEELRLIRVLVRSGEVLQDALSARRVHRVAHYAVEIARAFHGFYEKERVIGEPKEIEAARVLLVKGVFTILENILGVLGISKPKEM